MQYYEAAGKEKIQAESSLQMFLLSPPQLFASVIINFNVARQLVIRTQTFAFAVLYPKTLKFSNLQTLLSYIQILSIEY